MSVLAVRFTLALWHQDNFFQTNQKPPDLPLFYRLRSAAEMRSVVKSLYECFRGRACPNFHPLILTKKRQFFILRKEDQYVRVPVLFVSRAAMDALKNQKLFTQSRPGFAWYGTSAGKAYCVEPDGDIKKGDVSKILRQMGPLFSKSGCQEWSSEEFPDPAKVKFFFKQFTEIAGTFSDQYSKITRQGHPFWVSLSSFYGNRTFEDLNSLTLAAAHWFAEPARNPAFFCYLMLHCYRNGWSQTQNAQFLRLPEVCGIVKDPPGLINDEQALASLAQKHPYNLLAVLLEETKPADVDTLVQEITGEDGRRRFETPTGCEQNTSHSDV